MKSFFGLCRTCENKQKYTKQIMICGVVVNLILNSVGIQMIGMNGAAAATLVTEITCCLIAPLCFNGTREFVKYVVSSFNIMKLLRGGK